MFTFNKYYKLTLILLVVLFICVAHSHAATTPPPPPLTVGQTYAAIWATAVVSVTKCAGWYPVGFMIGMMLIL